MVVGVGASCVLVIVLIRFGDDIPAHGAMLIGSVSASREAEPHFKIWGWAFCFVAWLGLANLGQVGPFGSGG
jgi:hypothetical protein